MNRSFLLIEDFENIVRKLYLAEGYTFVEANAAAKDKGYDFSLQSPAGESILVEVKVFRSRVVARADILRVVKSLEAIRENAGARRAVLVISSSIGIPIVDTGNTEIIDLNTLADMVTPYPELAAELEALARNLSPMPASDFDVHAYRVFGDAYSGLRRQLEMASSPEPPKGAALAAALKAVPTTKKASAAFENKSEAAVRYIFENDFSNWSRQQVNDGGISRFDLIGRISSTHDFWKSIVTYFRSWYVVFEFKNYSHKLSQREIYSTEKYLYVGAMRTVAFVISPKGPDKNAAAVSRGAVREHGKLIVHLTVEDVCKMMQMKDDGDDANTFLFDRMDELLMTLGR